MAVVPTEVIWKWQQYENTFIAVFPLSPIPSKMFYNLLLTIDLQAVEIKVTFNEISFEQSVTSLIMSAHQKAAKWISLDWSSLDKRVIN